LGKKVIFPIAVVLQVQSPDWALAISQEFVRYANSHDRVKWYINAIPALEALRVPGQPVLHSKREDELGEWLKQ
jgi:hypothetical protein